jgi:hypothetical protein
MRGQVDGLIQGSGACTDVGVVMENRLGERRRTVLAVVSASVISLVVWALVLVLHVQ